MASGCSAATSPGVLSIPVALIFDHASAKTLITPAMSASRSKVESRNPVRSDAVLPSSGCSHSNS
jgi:hypothetical protein